MTSHDYTWATVLRGVLPPVGMLVAVNRADEWRVGRLIGLNILDTGCYVAGGIDPTLVSKIPSENLCWNLADHDTRAVFLSHLAIRHGAPREAVDQGVRFYFDPRAGGSGVPGWSLEAGVNLGLRFDPGGMAEWRKCFYFEGEWYKCSPERFWLAMALAWLDGGK